MNDNAAKNLFLLDGMALLYRAHFAFLRNPRLTSNGVNTSAVFGFMLTLLDILDKHQPSHLAIALDTREPTFRHQRYPEYKAQREAQPEDIAAALPLLDRLAAAMKIPVLRRDGYEADDIIGTLVRQAEPAGFTCYMVTPDKDFAQLVTPNTHLLRPAHQGGLEEWGVAEVRKKWGVQDPEQVVDMLGLWGDSSDNIPGVPGIGEKTAQKLIDKYGSVDGVLAHLGELKGKQQENLGAYAEQARLSRELATICTEVPLELRPEDLERQPADPAALRDLCVELEFRNLLDRLGLGGAGAPAPSAQLELFDLDAEQVLDAAEPTLASLATTAHDYRVASSIEARAELLAALGRQAVFCLDLETTSLDPQVAEVVGIAFSWQPHQGWFLPVPPPAEGGQNILEEFRPVLENPDTMKVGHNLKYDLGVLDWQGIAVGGKLFDTMLAHYLVNPEMRHGLDELARGYLAYDPVTITSMIGDGKQAPQKPLRQVPPSTLADYACEDADLTWQLYLRLRDELAEHDADKLYWQVEAPLIRVLIAMEREGVRIDESALTAFSRELEQQLVLLEQQVVREAGVDFNIDSPKQLGEVLFDHLKLDPKARRTSKTGQYSTTEQVLTELAGDHDIVRDILEYRQMRKLKNTYVDVLPGFVSPRTGRIHSDFNQALTATGRLSSANPNVQNIPIRSARGREIRKAFVPRGPDYLLLSADYSQIELRILAAISGDEGLCQAFANGRDVHRATAARIYHCDEEDVDATMRSRAKVANFGIAYGISAFGLAQRLHIPRGEAADIIEEYYRQFPGVKDYVDATIAFARDHGYVRTLLGRRRYLRHINSRNGTQRAGAERNAINAPIQGSAADLIKLAMINIQRRLEAGHYRSRMLLQVHDELLFDVHRDEVTELRPLIGDEMTKALPLAVPLEVETGIGENWLEAH